MCETGGGTDAYQYRLDITRDSSCKASVPENCGHVTSDYVVYKILQNLGTSGLVVLIQISELYVLENVC